MFTVGENYERIHLLDFVGSKQPQSGIIWGSKEPGCVICTSGGRHSYRAGYEDNERPDGSWVYFGQGEKGDQSSRRFANRLLLEGQKSVLLFTTREPTAAESRRRGSYKKRYRFEGTYVVAGWDTYVPGTGSRKGDTLLKFELVSAGDGAPLFPEDGPLAKPRLSLLELRDMLRSRGGMPKKGGQTQQEYKRANDDTKLYAKLRADGVCECCRQPAPFRNLQGQAYLEVHHICRLADDGPDLPLNVAAVCPNCHRRAHSGEDKQDLGRRLAGAIQLKESRLD